MGREKKLTLVVGGMSGFVLFRERNATNKTVT